MTEERFQRFEGKLDGAVADIAQLKIGQSGLVEDVAQLKAGQAGLVEDVANLKAGQAGLVEDVTQLKAGQAGLVDDVAQLRAGQAGLEAGQARIETRLDKLEVRQDDMHDHIKLIAESHSTVAILLDQGLQRIEDIIDRRLVPLEIAVRDLSRAANRPDASR